MMNSHSKNKFGNKKVSYDGYTFDSKKEASRYVELRLLEKSKCISNLEVHPKYELIPKQDGERAVTYSADFKYYDNEKNEHVVEDVKSIATKKDKTYINKRKMMLDKFGIKIREI